MSGTSIKLGKERNSTQHTSIKVEGIVLAAGLSTRMSYCKLEAEIEGVPLVQRVVQAALNSELDRVVIVSGTHDFSCLDTFGRHSNLSRLHMIANLHPERGMASSMRAGLEAVRQAVAGAMVLLGDQPGISTAIVNALLEEFRRNPDRIVVPFIFGRKTTPVIFPASLFPELANTTGDVGGRGVLARNAERISGVELGTEYDDTDVDTPEDLDRIRKNFAMKSKVD
ncbi:MAG: nucleotidyltransferase family protein [Desulfomonile tiedjei]|uniref:Nucleotidyltransferase family protein n=1 Tax=Desulfomonile tiedjei TaxID=2358 RepID=A0A9D6Z295_9BACT|nr:nucleotidyltransferase family protein [Desulfomonile tiedjei]